MHAMCFCTSSLHFSSASPGFAFKKWQADKVAGMMDNEDVQAFKADDREEYHEEVKTYKSGTEAAPEKEF